MQYSSALIPYCWLTTPTDREAWPYVHVTHRHNSHLTNLFISAVSNVLRTGHILNEEELKYLRLIISFDFGWSATSPAHMQDSAFRYIRHQFSSVGQLEPILDDMTYEEEVAWMPMSIPLGMAITMLFGTKERYYFYVVEQDSLYDAGVTLKEVYEGLQKVKYLLPLTGPGWQEIEAREKCLDSYSYFQDYDIFTRRLLYIVEDFMVPKVVKREI